MDTYLSEFAHYMSSRSWRFVFKSDAHLQIVVNDLDLTHLNSVTVSVYRIPNTNAYRLTVFNLTKVRDERYAEALLLCNSLNESRYIARFSIDEDNDIAAEYTFMSQLSDGHDDMFKDYCLFYIMMLCMDIDNSIVEIAELGK